MTSPLSKPLALALIALFVSCSALRAAADSFEAVSPNGRLKVHVALAGDAARGGRLTYGVSFDGKEVIESSQLGLECTNADWTNGLAIEGATTSQHDSTWKPVYGERAEIPDRYRETVITVKRARGGRGKLELIVRAYDEGIAFRYRFTEHADGGEYVHLTKENTQFVLPKDTKGWFAPASQAAYTLQPISAFSRLCERPLTVELPNGLFACLAEAEVVNFVRMLFVRDPENPWALRTSLHGPVDDIAPFATPWRVVMVAEKAGQLLEANYLLLNLNPPTALADTSWIKPGKVMREVTLSTAGARGLVDFAAARKLQYIEFDAGWYGYENATASDATKVSIDPRRNPRNDLDLPGVIAYAKSKGIGVWLYVNQRALAAQLDEILPLYEKWGVKGVKFGFVQVGPHRWTVWLHEAVKKAARHHLMVDIHDDFRPTGFSRTYPNLLTQEGIRGNEEFPDATHNATLPFTRYIAGAGDYTICYYRRDFGGSPASPQRRLLKNSPAHQLSLAVVYYSPLQFLYWYDRPSEYQGEPEVEFFDHVPTVWDDTKVLQGEIARYASVARRKGDEWFVGTITNNDARQLDVALSFLPPGRPYEASIYSDDPSVSTRTKVGIMRKRVDSSTVLRADLQPAGGQAIWLRPVR